jgi:hypothetical protein
MKEMMETNSRFCESMSRLALHVWSSVWMHYVLRTSADWESICLNCLSCYHHASLHEIVNFSLVAKQACSWFTGVGHNGNLSG